MNNPNSLVLKAFNKHFFEFIDDIVLLFPRNTHITESRDMILTMKKANPTALIKIWNYFIAEPYIKEIEVGDISFFIEKDYSSDLRYLPNSKEILDAVDATIRNPLREMDEINRSHCIKHIQLISQLSGKYKSS
jgi:hypothetical protein